MRKYWPMIPIAAAFVFSIAVYGQLPERMPLHWDWSGQPDRWGNRVEGAFLLPAIALGMWILLRFLPKIDPRRANYERFGGTYDMVVGSVVTFMAGLHVILVGVALGWPIAVNRVVPAAVGVLLIVIGNLLPRARSNWWFGIRTPWTLSSDRVWQKTHRVGGYLTMLAGAGLLFHAIVAQLWTVWLSGALVALSVVGTMVYSYLKWREEGR